MASRSSSTSTCGHARDLLDLHVARARRRRRQRRGGPVRKLLQDLQVGAEDLDRQVALDARDQLVDAQRDRLRERQPQPGNGRPARRCMRLDQLRPCSAPSSTRCCGLSMMKTSFCSGPIGSSEISARPVLVTTVATSGKRAGPLLDHASPTATEPSSEAFGSRTTLMAIEPSSSGGMKSVPSSGTSAARRRQAPPRRCRA